MIRIEQRKRYWVVTDDNQVYLITKNKNIANYYKKMLEST